MKLLTVLYAKHAPGKGRCPQPPNKVPFQAILPMELKERVSGKADKGGGKRSEEILVKWLHY